MSSRQSERLSELLDLQQSDRLTADEKPELWALMRIRIPRQENYSWEVEQDAMAWESAIGGIVTMERQLRELRGLNG